MSSDDSLRRDLDISATEPNPDAPLRRTPPPSPLLRRIKNSEAFIVNLGDLLERWSNCIFKSTLHRVLGNGQQRYSIAYFIEPSHDCVVECLPTCKSEKNPPQFPPIVCQNYLTQRYKDTHADLKVYKDRS